MKRIIPLFAVLAAIALALPASHAQTLTGAQAQKSPQADVFLAYEQALNEKGVDAAGAHATPAKLAQMRAELKQLGEASFKEMQAMMRARTPQGEARRKQIEKVEVKGDHAVLAARDSPKDPSVSVVYFARTKDGWKVDVRR